MHPGAHPAHIAAAVTPQSRPPMPHRPRRRASRRRGRRSPSRASLWRPSASQSMSPMGPVCVHRAVGTCCRPRPRFALTAPPATTALPPQPVRVGAPPISFLATAAAGWHGCTLRLLCGGFGLRTRFALTGRRFPTLQQMHQKIVFFCSPPSPAPQPPCGRMSRITSFPKLKPTATDAPITTHLASRSLPLRRLTNRPRAPAHQRHRSLPATGCWRASSPRQVLPVSSAMRLPISLPISLSIAYTHQQAPVLDSGDATNAPALGHMGLVGAI